MRNNNPDSTNISNFERHKCDTRTEQYSNETYTDKRFPCVNRRSLSLYIYAIDMVSIHPDYILRWALGKLNQVQNSAYSVVSVLNFSLGCCYWLRTRKWLTEHRGMEKSIRFPFVLANPIQFCDSFYHQQATRPDWKWSPLKLEELKKGGQWWTDQSKSNQLMKLRRNFPSCSESSSKSSVVHVNYAYAVHMCKEGWYDKMVVVLGHNKSNKRRRSKTDTSVFCSA